MKNKVLLTECFATKFVPSAIERADFFATPFTCVEISFLNLAQILHHIKVAISIPLTVSVFLPKIAEFSHESKVRRETEFPFGDVVVFEAILFTLIYN